MRKGKSSYLVTIQADAETYSAEEEIELRALLGAANAIDPNILTALVTYATQNSRKYVKEVKRPKVEEYHNQQQMLFGNIQWRMQKTPEWRMFIEAYHRDLTPAQKVNLRGTDLILALSARFTRDTVLEKQKKLERFLALRFRSGETATHFCILLEQRALEILSHGHPGTLDTLAVNQLLTSLAESTTYTALAQSLQLHIDRKSVV
jgi:hypothetical protein